MNQSQILALAKQGDAAGINTAIDRAFQAKGIESKISLNDRCLHIMLESKEVPDREFSMAIIRQAAIALAVSSIDSVKVYARQVNDEFPAWDEEIFLSQNSTNSGGENIAPVVQPTSDIDIQQGIQSLLGDNFGVNLTRTKSQLSIVITKPEQTEIDYRSLLKFLERYDFNQLSYWEKQGVKEFKIYEKKQKGSLKGIFKIKAINSADLSKPAKSNLPINLPTIAVGILCLMFPLAVWLDKSFEPKHKKQAIKLKLENINYCPPEMLKSDTQLAAPSNLYTKFRVTGPVIDEFGTVGKCVAIDVYINNNFTVKQQDMIKLGAQIMAKRAMQERIFKCTYKLAYRNYKGTSPENDEFQLRNAVWNSIVYVDNSDLKDAKREVFLKGGNLYIDNFNDTDTIIGRAKINYFYRRRHLKIELNTDYLDNKYSKGFYYEDPEFWASVIAHEILHNLGWTHEEGWWNEAVKGTVMGGYEVCIKTNGIPEDTRRNTKYD